MVNGRKAALAALLLSLAPACSDRDRPSDSNGSSRPAQDRVVHALAGGDERFSVVLAPTRGRTEGDLLVSGEIGRAVGRSSVTALSLHVYRNAVSRKRGEPAPVSDATPIAVSPLSVSLAGADGPLEVVDPGAPAVRSKPAGATKDGFRMLSAYREVSLEPGQGFTAMVAVAGNVRIDAITRATVEIGGRPIELAPRTLARALFEDLNEAPTRATLVAVLSPGDGPAVAPAPDAGGR